MRRAPRAAVIAAGVVMATLPAGCGTQTPARTGPTVTVHVGGGIPAYLKRRARPIGRGPSFHPSLNGTPTGACRPRFTPRFEAHIEVFGANRVVLLPGGIGTRPPRRILDGQLAAAACFGSVVTLNDEGILYVRPGSGATLQTLFRAWGQPLTATRIASFSGREPVRVYVNGRRVLTDPRRLRIRPRAEIVIEVGPAVPPHAHFTYPAFPQVS